MTVTILVPVYGVEKYIADCAESLFAQTYPDIKYVFCNDCSPDRSIELLKDAIAKHPEHNGAVSIVNMEKNTGIGGVRARLLKEVHTDCFCFVDSDDLLPRDAVEILVKRMEETDADVVEGAYSDYINGQAEKKELAFHGTDKKYLKRFLCQNIEVNRIWGKLYKANVISKLPDMFYEGIDLSEDYCAIARLSALTSRTWTDRLVYFYRKDNASSYTKSQSLRNCISYLSANNKVLSFYHQRGHLPLSLEVGLLNTYRQPGIRSGMTAEEVDRLLPYVPEHCCARLVYRMLRSRKFYSLGDLLYRILRTIVAL